jgi:hypothetical protein
MEADPLAGKQLAIDRLGDQGMAEDVAVTARLGEEHLPVDRAPSRSTTPSRSSNSRP